MDGYDRKGLGYEAEMTRWRADPEAWWMARAGEIEWTVSPSRALQPELGGHGRWFAGGRLNTCHNAVDRHVAAGRGGQLAIVHDSPVTGRVAALTDAGLLARVAKLAGALAARGVAAGDRVVICVPMVLEAAVAMLACARLGAVPSVVFGGFAAAELAARIEDAKPRAVIAASCGLEPGRTVPYKPLLDAAIGRSAHKPAFCLVLQRKQGPCALVAGRDFDLIEAEAAAEPHPCVAVAATDPLDVLHTSGRPKGLVPDNGGHAVALRSSMGMIYGVGAGDVFCAASEVGWVVGHSYIVCSPLPAGCTTVLFEGKPVGTPDAATYWRVCARQGVKVRFTAPTAMGAIRKEDPELARREGHDLSRIEALFLAGERCDPATAPWAGERLGVPVVDHRWQTETGGAITAGFRGLGLFEPRPGSGGKPSPGYDVVALDEAGRKVPRGQSGKPSPGYDVVALDEAGREVPRGQSGKPSPGYDVVALDEAGREVPRGQTGTLALRLPLPPSCLPTLWNAEARFREAYLSNFPGFHDTADSGMVDEDGLVWVMGHPDDIINVAGHRLSTGAMDEVVAAHPDVAECAVVGAADALKGQPALALVVRKAGVTKGKAEFAKELAAMARERIGPVAAFKEARAVARLPKTRSGKILRATLRKLADGPEFAAPATIGGPAILDEIRGAIGR